MNNTIVQHNQVQGKCSQTGIFPTTEEVFDDYPVFDFKENVHNMAVQSSSEPEIRSKVAKKDFKGIVTGFDKALETECKISRNGFLKKLDYFSTWVIYKLLPKSLTSNPPPDRQIYY